MSLPLLCRGLQNPHSAEACLAGGGNRLRNSCQLGKSLHSLGDVEHNQADKHSVDEIMVLYIIVQRDLGSTWKHSTLYLALSLGYYRLEL